MLSHFKGLRSAAAGAFVVVLMAAGLAVPTGPILADEVKLKIHIIGPPRGLFVPLVKWSENVTAATNGEVQFEVLWGGVLGSWENQIDNLKVGLFDIGPLAPSFLEAKAPLMSAGELPFISSNVVAYGKACLEWLTMPELEQEFAAWNQKLLFFTVAPDQEYWGNKPIRSLDDFKGLRAWAGGVFGRALSALGGTPILVPVSELGMGLLLGVGQGSALPPRMLVMRHEPPDAPAEPVLALVGKGVTFDTGGISIKPAAGMEWMKSDMAGGAAVIGAMRAIGTLGARRRVIGIVPMAENMPGGRAIRPGDILTGASGTTVEVLNTDAEGRLILGDALWYARECGATHLVDVATLTGACVVALGGAASGLFARPAAWSDALQAAGERAGERVWPMPLYEDYREQLRSELADLKNIGGREGGACTAAAFLEAFAGGLPWAHLDIAGTAWIEKPREDAAAGATGVMVRTLTELAIGEWNW